MGAEVTIYVKVLKGIEEVIEVSGITKADGELEALKQKDVIRVISSSYNKENIK